MVKLICKKEFTTVTLSGDNKTFIIDVTFLICSDILPLCRVQIVLLLTNKATFAILSKYSEYADIFSFESITGLL